MMRTLAERFWEKVDKKGPTPAHCPELGPCWVWTAHRTCNGYGRIGRGGKYGKIDGAHRVSWEVEYGSVPEGMDVLHACDNPPCVNPSHLFIGTAKDNIDDMLRKGRDRHRHGEAHRDARLTEQQVRDIRANKALCRVSDRELGERYGVSNVAISRIVRRITWKHVC